MLSIYDVPLLSLLFLFCVFEVFSFKESKPRRYGFYVVYTLITLIMLADAAYSSYFGKYISVNQLYQVTSLGQIAGGSIDLYFAFGLSFDQRAFVARRSKL